MVIDCRRTSRVFPAPAGVSRGQRYHLMMWSRIPRVSGGESDAELVLGVRPGVFPAPAGVSPFSGVFSLFLQSIPRASGGESTWA